MYAHSLSLSNNQIKNMQRPLWEMMGMHYLQKKKSYHHEMCSQLGFLHE